MGAYSNSSYSAEEIDDAERTSPRGGAIGQDCPAWEVRAGELADLLARALPYVQMSNRSYALWLEAASKAALARYHAAAGP